MQDIYRGLFVMFLLFGLTGCAGADGGLLDWAVRAGGARWDSGYCVSSLADGSALVTGRFEGDATFGPGEGGETVLATDENSLDGFVAKYEDDGTLAWARHVEGSSSEIYGLPDGSFLLTGSFGGVATFGRGETNETVLSSEGQSDIFVASYNPDGTLAWARRDGGMDAEWGNGVAALPDGSSVVTGAFSGTALFGEGQANETVLSSNGSFDVFVARYDADGSLAWAAGAGGADRDFGHGVSMLPDGSPLVTGSFRATAVFGTAAGEQAVLASAGGMDVFVARYRLDGSLAWAVRAGGSNPCVAVDATGSTETGDLGAAIAALPDGTSFVVGYICDVATFGPGEPNETILDTPGGLNDWDAFLARYNPDGSLAWATRAGGTGVDHAWGVTSLDDESCVVTGDFEDVATFGPDGRNESRLASAGGLDAFAARYDSDGTLAWVRRAGGEEHDSGHGVSAFPDGSSLVTGHFAGTAAFGTGGINRKSLKSAGGYDVFVMRLNP